MTAKLTTEDFIRKAREKHGDLYDYSLVEYTVNKNKVKIICKIHGIFEQAPRDHLRKYKAGCQKCGNIKQGKSRSKTTAINNPLSNHFVSKEFDWIKNYPLTPNDFSISSGKKCWWICCNNHSYISSISNRTNQRISTGCPFCSNQAVCCYNSFGCLYPELIKYWDWEKNRGTTPWDVVAGGHKKFNFKCLVAEDHKWEAPIYNISRNKSGCPCCDGKKTVNSNCLETLRPDLVPEWHEDNILKPNEVTCGSNKKIKWKCLKNENHEYWIATPHNRALNDSGCPSCIEFKGETSVELILKKLCLVYYKQYKFKSCYCKSSKHPLRFDFMVLKDGIKYLIEYHGKQHYEYYSFGSKSTDAKKEFKALQRRDKIKRNFCNRKANIGKIKFLEIPYWEFDQIEDKILKFLGLTPLKQ